MTSEEIDQIEYEASCQCGQAKYTVTCNPIESQPVTTCDCSICTRNGYALIYVPRSSVNWTSGYDTLKNFRFHVKRNDHKFCPECGSSMMIDPNFWYSKIERLKEAPDVVALNIRMFKDIKLEGLNYTKEGWAWKPPK